MKWSSMGLFSTPVIKIDVEDVRKAGEFFFDEIYPHQSSTDGLTFHKRKVTLSFNMMPKQFNAVYQVSS